MGERPRRLVALLVSAGLGTGVARAVSLKASFDPSSARDRDRLSLANNGIIIGLLLLTRLAAADVLVTFDQTDCTIVPDGWRLYAASLDPPGSAFEPVAEIPNASPPVCGTLQATVPFTFLDSQEAFVLTAVAGTAESDPSNEIVVDLTASSTTTTTLPPTTTTTTTTTSTSSTTTTTLLPPGAPCQHNADCASGRCRHKHCQGLPLALSSDCP